ncbi:uncharacterized protein EAF01_001398 [Botrytis porri]|uniref:uncharacterized protein n=1 Tax=Botrytis porri TaxID=87229 RepID=UPI00190023EC|nr:uncharacterized protein EAF01_001398 [Botrytis porri]KAF7912377.1 hypothetical protein EAF01_001398 [Botrytis porri]
MAELGEDMAANAKMHLGLDGHVTDPNKSTLAATKQDALSEFVGWRKKITFILSLLNEHVDIWAIFDILDHFASTYAKERKILTEDPVHTASPHHGPGAGFAI